MSEQENYKVEISVVIKGLMLNGQIDSGVNADDFAAQFMDNLDHLNCFRLKLNDGRHLVLGPKQIKKALFFITEAKS